MEKLPSYIGMRFWGLLIVAIFLILYVSESLEKSMFIDGVWYATISRNLAEGNGSFWFPQFSATIFSEFHEHPGLVFWIQSLFFKVFGDHFWTERIFGLFQYFANVGLLYLIWQEAFRNHASRLQRLWFIPILLWQVNIVTYFFQSANLLDTTLSIFNLAAIYFMMQNVQRKHSYGRLITAGIFISLAILSKGLVALFPLTFYGSYWIVFREKITLAKVWVNTSFIIVTIGAFFCLLFILNPESMISIGKYLEVQVLASLNGERRLYYYQTNRLFILGQLAWTLAPMILLLVLFFFLEKIIPAKKLTAYPIKYPKLFFLVGLSASIPLIISPRQALPYLVPCLPYFSLSFAFWITPILEAYLKKLDFGKKAIRKKLEFGGICLLGTGLILVTYKFKQPNQRDAQVIQDVEKIGEIIGQEKIISSTHYDMYISGYLMRYHKISLDTSFLTRNYLIAEKTEKFENPDYEKIPIATEKFDLFQKKETSSKEDTLPTIRISQKLQSNQ